MQAFGAEGFDKSGTDLKADGVDEKNEREIAEEEEDLIVGFEAELAHQQGGEEDAADAEFDVGDGDIADGQADGDRQREDGQAGDGGSRLVLAEIEKRVDGTYVG